MKKIELINFLKCALPNETRIYEVDERVIKLSGVELDVSDCVDEWGRVVFSGQEVRRITNIGELREYVNQGHLPFLYIRNYTCPSIIKLFIEKLTDGTFD